MRLVVTGKTKQSRDELKQIILSLGGKMDSQVNEQTVAVISTEKELKKMDYKMEAAKQHGIQVVPEKFLDDVREPGADAIQLIKTMSMCDWGTDVSRIYMQKTIFIHFVIFLYSRLFGLQKKKIINQNQKVSTRNQYQNL